MRRGPRRASIGSVEVCKRLLLCVLLGGALSAVVGVGQAGAAPPTPVTCGSTIAAPGQYYLASDCTGDGISIAASHVHLKLDGHTMTGLGPGSGRPGIRANGVSRLHLQGPGTITRFRVGISFGGSGNGVNDSHVEKVTTTTNFLAGVAVFSSQDVRFTNDVATGPGQRLGFVQRSSSGIHYDHVTASSNDSIGIFLETGSTATHIDGSTANDNVLFGIILDKGSTANHIDGNTALGNVVDLVDNNLGCDSNVWEGNHFARANQPCIS